LGDQHLIDHTRDDSIEPRFIYLTFELRQRREAWVTCAQTL
jgi:hypothetical protein